MATGSNGIELLLQQATQQLGAGDFAQAVDTFRQVLSQDAKQRDALILGGQAAFQAGMREEAIAWMERAKEAYPDDPDTSHNLGVAYSSIGNLNGALAAFENAIRVKSDFAPALYNLGMTLHELGRDEDSLSYFDKAIAADPGNVEAYSSKGFVLRSMGRVDEAIATYAKALEKAPGNAKILVGYGTCLQESDRAEKAVTAYRSAIAADPDYADACGNLSDALVQAGKPGEAIEACDAYLARHPGDAMVLATKSVALNEAGDRAGLNSLVNLDELIRVMRLKPPSNFSTLEEFNDALSSDVTSDGTLTVSPASHTTRMGKQTGAINAPAKGAVAILENLLGKALDRYSSEIAGLGNHPTVTTRPSSYRINMWATVLEGEGYQAPHIHPDGWLSGVYYPKMPAEAEAGGHEGWIEFGQPGPEYHFSAEPTLRLVKPEPGMLVLFPSFMFHRTIPFQSKDTRISIAFDVIPR